MSKPAAVNPIGGSGTDESRDSACTPKWVAVLIGPVDLDPASNERSHIVADRTCDLSTGGNGLLEDDGDGVIGPGCFNGRDLEQFDGALQTNVALKTTRVFCNPPYARGEVIKWVRHYLHTRFIFLLRWDPRTKWFRALIPHCTHVWFPMEVGESPWKGPGEHPGRIEFEPPPGVTFSSNPFPHALYLREPDEALLLRLAPHGLLLPVDKVFLAQYLAVHEDKRDGVVQEDVGGRGESGDTPREPSGGGGGIPKLAARRRRWCKGCKVNVVAEGDGDYCYTCFRSIVGD